MLAGVPIQTILFTVFQSIFQVFLLCLAGFVLSFNGIVDKPTSKVLNHLNVALFTPALLFSKVAFFLSPAKLRQLWVIPIFFAFLTGLSAVIARTLAQTFRLKRSQTNFATAASMFMNSNSLPVALMQSLATTVPLLKWDPDDTVDAMFGRSLTYLVVFSTLGMILRWSYGIRLLTQADEPEPASSTYRDDDGAHDHPALTSLAGSPPLVNYEAEPDIPPDGQPQWRTRPLRSRLPHPRLTPVARRHTHPYVHLHSRLPAVPTSLGDQSESEESDEFETTEGESEDTIAPRPEVTNTGFSAEVEVEDPASRTPHPPPVPSPADAIAHPVPRWDRARPSLWTCARKTLTSLSPPLVASLFALFVVLVPPLQRLLKSQEMIPFKGAIDNAGACSVPLTLVVLGGWFWDGEPKGKTQPGRNAKGASDAHGTPKGKSAPGSLDAGPDPPDVRPEQTTSLRRRHHVTHDESRNSSSASLSSIIGTFGDVLMARMRSRGSSAHARRRAGGSVVAPATEAGVNMDVNIDVERGPRAPSRLAMHTETVRETHHDSGRASRSRSANGHARQSPGTPTAKSTPPPAHSQAHPPPEAQGKNPPGETLTVVLTLLARMVIVPLVVTPMMILVSRLGWGGEVFEDPVFIVSSMLLVASPPALTLAQISQRAKSAAADADAFSPFERLLSRTVFWAYLVLTPPITIASVMVGLLLIGG